MSDAAAEAIIIRGVLCSRKAIVRGIRNARHPCPKTGEMLKGMRAVGARAGVHSSTISRRLSAGGILSSDATGLNIETAIVDMLPDMSRYRAQGQQAGPGPATGATAQPQAQAQAQAQPQPQPAPPQPQPAPPQPQPQPAPPQPQPAPPQPQPAPPQPQPQPQPSQPSTSSLDALSLAQLVKRIHKPLNDARNAIRSGALDSVMGLRKAALVCRIMGALEREGWARKDALSAAYYSAVAAKEPEDMRLHVVEPFVSEFGFEPMLPALDKLAKDPTNPNAWVHPVVPFLIVLLREGIHVWMYGEAGTGKSRAARDAARLLQRTSTVFACHKHTHTDDALGGKELREGQTIDRLGPWPLAMQAGGVLILEEPSKAHPGVLAVAHSMLEERELTIPTMEGPDSLVRAADGFVCVAADNAEAGRDPGRYVAVNQMDPAFLDRFAMVEVGPLPVTAELEIMERAYAPVGVDK